MIKFIASVSSPEICVNLPCIEARGINEAIERYQKMLYKWEISLIHAQIGTSKISEKATSSTLSVYELSERDDRLSGFISIGLPVISYLLNGKETLVH